MLSLLMMIITFIVVLIVHACECGFLFFCVDLMIVTKPIAQSTATWAGQLIHLNARLWRRQSSRFGARTCTSTLIYYPATTTVSTYVGLHYPIFCIVLLIIIYFLFKMHDRILMMNSATIYVQALWKTEGKKVIMITNIFRFYKNVHSWFQVNYSYFALSWI